MMSSCLVDSRRVLRVLEAKPSVIGGPETGPSVIGGQETGPSVIGGTETGLAPPCISGVTSSSPLGSHCLCK